ncbi:MAG: TatD family nuclease-associated radical SAM protein, partial [[Eubacterium] saphenum]|nr:TatD family nuclease-associated radical SAM protein [[Eubacterium] saphenum]
RKNADSVCDNDSLWLEHEPSFDEIKAAFEKFDKSGAREAVFCGYGEPTVRVEMLLETAKLIRENTDMKIRLNTNGLVRLIHKDFDITRFKGLLDSVSVSLNAPTAKRYNEVTRPSFGEAAFDEMLKFAADMKNLGIQTGFTVVDIISDEEIAECGHLAEKLGIPLRVRHYITDNESYT